MGNIIKRKKANLKQENEILQQKCEKYNTLFKECNDLYTKKINYLQKIIEEQKIKIELLDINNKEKENIIKELQPKVEQQTMKLSVVEQRKIYKQNKVNRRRR